MRRSLATLALAVTSMVALAFLLPLGLVVGELARDRALTEAERQASALAPVLVITTDAAQLRRAVASTPMGSAGRLVVHLPGGTVLGASRVPSHQPAVAAAEGRSYTTSAPGGQVVLQPILLGHDGTAVVEAFVPEEELTRGVGTAWLVLSCVALGLVACSVFVADRLGSRMVRSVATLAAGAKEIGSGNTEARVEVDGPRELAEVGAAFNAMAERVATLLRAEREFVADLSHRLRTPLTALLLDAEAFGRDPRADQVRQSVYALEFEVNEIIRTARGGLAERAEEGCDAASVLRDRLAFWSALAEDQERPWRLRGVDRPVTVPVSRADLVAATDALLSNIFRHTPHGVAFAVSLHAEPGRVTIAVDDAGPGVRDPKAAVRRGASGRGSTGLGLDIVDRLARGTGGALHVERGPLGGARFRLVLGGGPRGRQPAPAPAE
ncbi:Signal transduction histidine kinase [Streptoalloteichus tenebrarius]|uniref:Signal transduction histidine-protein kinase/phosphatase MprB n=1 Tax=Streptoalloteichus tenebrarius (strain ATCC 17920 / DSM 40477 / JCM 4838 / CBS 697.72 / NBRC 16177 / NCIMB 11028 / NRRL B-12390 / A12253. 1 / ISP 5477) TaxID=1933 RepID=A0ABT1HY29_STRSD|nr:HAMP domain-containing sensor histidine kinase [Streptoalloteichus tenebrarius]MCP2260423.1 Signal transduction histidine kinase [Streptoalloteichus tenebrarius]BFF02469.1 HAMP domain-containing sensor histidine kinase [Streptoalloteichus tenebrarius]